jgi:hypothetical protein
MEDFVDDELMCNAFASTVIMTARSRSDMKRVLGVIQKYHRGSFCRIVYNEITPLL